MKKNVVPAADIYTSTKEVISPVYGWDYRMITHYKLPNSVNMLAFFCRMPASGQHSTEVTVHSQNNEPYNPRYM